MNGPEASPPRGSSKEPLATVDGCLLASVADTPRTCQSSSWLEVPLLTRAWPRKHFAFSPLPGILPGPLFGVILPSVFPRSPLVNQAAPDAPQGVGLEDVVVVV